MLIYQISKSWPLVFLPEVRCDHRKIVVIQSGYGASMLNSKKLFNNGLDSAKHRSIDFMKEDVIPEEDSKNLIREVIALNKQVFNGEFFLLYHNSKVLLVFIGAV